MKSSGFAVLFVLASTLVFAQSRPSLSQSPLAKGAALNGLSQPATAAQREIIGSYGKLPLSFEANQGQTDSKVKFLSRASGYTLFLTSDEAVFSLRTSEPTPNTSPVGELRPKLVVPKTSAVLRMKLHDANPVAKVTGVDELPGKSNYFIGPDPTKWRSNVPTYTKVKYEQIYSGIDLVYYGNQRQIEYDFVVAPGADPQRIQLDVQGAKSISQDQHGDLHVQTSAGEVRWAKPVIYQEKYGVRREIEGRYLIKRGNRIGLEVASYDRQYPLIIDPALGYSTFLGGSSVDVGQAIAVDNAGNAYLTGETTSTDFPTTSGALQTICGGGCTNGTGDVFVTKIAPGGAALVYSTYLGGNSNDDGTSIALDSSGDAYITGSTTSSDFPITPGAFQTSYGGNADAFVAVLDPTGSALVYSTYLGGNNAEYSAGIAVDASHEAYVVGQTCSTNFPTSAGAFQPSYGGGDCSGGGDGFVAKFNAAGTSVVYSTYIGGSNDDNGGAIAIDTLGDAYIVGGTTSSDFPITPGTFQTSLNGYADGFVAALNPTGSALVYSAYLGGSGGDWAVGIALDGKGDAFVTGETPSIDFPTTPGAFQTVCGGGCGGGTYDTFVTEINPIGSALIYSTYLGGSSFDYVYGIALDGSGDAYVAGWTQSTDFPVTPGAFQTICGGVCVKPFLTEVNPAGTDLVYSTYIGGTYTDFGYALAVDSFGNPYITGLTESQDFPVTPGVFQMACSGGRCSDAFVVEFVSGDQVWPLSLDFGNEAVGASSTQQNATLTNSGSSALTITSIKIGGADDADFSQSNNCGTSVPAGGNCNISVTFTPSAMGARNANVSIVDSAANSPQVVALSGAGVPSTAILTPTNLNFGSQLVGITSGPLPVILSTNGSLTINSITTSSQFAQTNNCGSGLPAGGSCTINVTFTPAAPGVQNGTLSVSDNGFNSPQITTLTGTGTEPRVKLSPTSLNFGNQTVDITSAPQVSTLTNTGTGTLTVTAITVIGANSSDFLETNNCGTSVPAGGSCQITVNFKPAGTGSETASVRIADSAPHSPQSLPLTGVGVLPAVTFSPTSLTFPTQVVFTTSPAQQVTLTNTGLGILKITGGGVSGQFGGSATCGKTVAPGASCTINVVFEPRTKGPLSGAITAKDNAPDSPQTVPLSGTGTFVQLSPKSVGFGNQPVNTTSNPKYITLTNKGSSPVNFTGITVTGTDAGDFAEINNCGSSLVSGANCKIKVTFTPLAKGKRTADVSISDDGGGSPQMVPLTGTGTP